MVQEVEVGGVPRQSNHVVVRKDARAHFPQVFQDVSSPLHFHYVAIAGDFAPECASAAPQELAWPRRVVEDDVAARQLIVSREPRVLQVDEKLRVVVEEPEPQVLVDKLLDRVDRSGIERPRQSGAVGRRVPGADADGCQRPANEKQRMQLNLLRIIFALFALTKSAKFSAAALTKNDESHVPWRC